jgi:hypothetical protein
VHRVLLAGPSACAASAPPAPDRRDFEGCIVALPQPPRHQTSGDHAGANPQLARAVPFILPVNLPPILPVSCSLSLNILGFDDYE